MYFVGHTCSLNPPPPPNELEIVKDPKKCFLNSFYRALSHSTLHDKVPMKPPSSSELRVHKTIRTKKIAADFMSA